MLILTRTQKKHSCQIFTNIYYLLASSAITLTETEQQDRFTPKEENIITTKNYIDDSSFMTNKRHPEKPQSSGLQQSALSLPSQQNSIYVQSIENNRDGRDYSKKHACYYCKKKVSNCKIPRHVERKHKEEILVAQLPRKSDDSRKKEREIQLDKIRNMGNFNSNIDVLMEGKGELLVGRRPTEMGKHSFNDYLPCEHCLTLPKHVPSDQNHYLLLVICKKRLLKNAFPQAPCCYNWQRENKYWILISWNFNEMCCILYKW